MHVLVWLCVSTREAIVSEATEHLMGLDHTKLTYRFAGRDFRLTDMYGRVVNAILA